jgi:hypothetical protein
MAYNASSLDSFICYYLHLGFATLYLYLDDPTDTSVAIAKRYPTDRVKVRVRDAALRKEWAGLPSWARLELYSQREVQARQMLNCEHAIARCRSAGEQWLLHVDSDELLLLPAALSDERAVLACAAAGGGANGGSKGGSKLRAPGSALQDHLAELDKLGAILFTYRNLEAVPEALECDDMYRRALCRSHAPTEQPPARVPPLTRPSVLVARRREPLQAAPLHARRALARRATGHPILDEC